MDTDSRPADMVLVAAGNPIEDMAPADSQVAADIPAVPVAGTAAATVDTPAVADIPAADTDTATDMDMLAPRQDRPVDSGSYWMGTSRFSPPPPNSAGHDDDE